MPLLPKVPFHHHVFATNLMTNSLRKMPNKQISQIFVMSVSLKFAAKQIGLRQTDGGKTLVRNSL
jgi:hypothetical protein